MFFDDEQLGCFLYRSQKLNGERIFRNIIHTTGGFSKSGRPLKGLAHYYDSINKYKLYCIIRGGREILNNEEMLNSVEKTSTLLNGEYRLYLNTGRDRNIYFCSECIKDSLIHNGVAYLKESWLHFKWCPTHHDYLSFKPVRSYDETVQTLDKLLSGDTSGPFYKANSMR